MPPAAGHHTRIRPAAAGGAPPLSALRHYLRSATTCAPASYPTRPATIAQRNVTAQPRIASRGGGANHFAHITSTSHSRIKGLRWALTCKDIDPVRNCPFPMRGEPQPPPHSGASQLHFHDKISCVQPPSPTLSH